MSSIVSSKLMRNLSVLISAARNVVVVVIKNEYIIVLDKDFENIFAIVYSRFF